LRRAGAAVIGRPTIVEFATDPELLALTLSPAQETLLRAIYGLELSPDQLELWQQYTGRTVYPAHPFREVTVVAGARAGKDSRIAAPIALYEALFGGHPAHLAKGERAVIPCVAADHRGTRVLYGYLHDYVVHAPLLHGMVEDVLADELRLIDRTSIVTFPSRAAAVRGWSIPAAVMDELAFWRLEGQADSDAEIQAALRRGMAGFPAPRLVKISTPYLRGGVLYDDFRRGYGQEDPDLLVWRAPSVVMNPTLAGDQLAQARRLDPARFRREFDADWTDSLVAFLADTILDVAPDRAAGELRGAVRRGRRPERGDGG
jgi:hypothetical protein